MPADFSKFNLSAAGLGGLGITVTASGTPGDLIHTAVSGADLQDEVYLYAVNHDTSQADLTLEWGGVASGDQIEVGVPNQQGLVLLVPGLPVSGGVAIRGFSPTSGAVTIHGFVNRIDGS